MRGILNDCGWQHGQTFCVVVTLNGLCCSSHSFSSLPDVVKSADDCSWRPRYCMDGKGLCTSFSAILTNFQTRENMIPLEVTPGLELNNRFGVFSHSDLIGLPYGTKVSSRNGRGFVYVLRPTPELWTLALPHRTQILYLADIAFIISSLNIRPGSSVIEAGTLSYVPSRFP